MAGDDQSARWLIHFSGDDWWQSNPHSRHHITFQFHKKGYRVLWINPMGLRFPSIRKGGFFRKLLNKLKSLSRSVEEVRPVFFVYTFAFLPVFKRGVIERLNTLFVEFQIRRVRRRLGIDQAVAFVTLPTFAPMVRYARNAGILDVVIYYYSDQYDKYREIRDPGPILAWDRMLQEDADAIYCASEDILNNIGQDVRSSKIARVIDHQVDFDHFDFHRVKPYDWSLPGPVIGYFGSITDSNDWEMIEYAARQRPEWQFVFLGKQRIELPALEALPNVHFHGFVPYENLPALAAGFDVGIMFWKMTDWIRACSPLKLKEYLALGLPVVSVPINEVVTKYRDFVEIADDGPAFVRAVAAALARDDREARRTYAQQFSWANVTERMLKDVGID